MGVLFAASEVSEARATKRPGRLSNSIANVTQEIYSAESLSYRLIPPATFLLPLCRYAHFEFLARSSRGSFSTDSSLSDAYSRCGHAVNSSDRTNELSASSCSRVGREISVRRKFLPIKRMTRRRAADGRAR